MDIEYARPDEQDTSNDFQDQRATLQAPMGFNSHQPALFQPQAPLFSQNTALQPMSGLFAMPPQNSGQFNGGQQFNFFGNQGASNTFSNGFFNEQPKNVESVAERQLEPADLLSDDDQPYEPSEESGEEESSEDEEGMEEMVEDEGSKLVSFRTAD